MSDVKVVNPQVIVSTDVHLVVIAALTLRGDHIGDLNITLDWDTGLGNVFWAQINQQTEPA